VTCTSAALSIGSSRLPQRKLSSRTWTGIGLLAIPLWATWPALAFLSGLSWASYCVFRLLWPEGDGRVLQQGCAVSTLLCAGLHVIFEPTITGEPAALLASIAIGVVPLAIRNFAWDEGFRRGDSRLLAVMAYATPLCSALLLVGLGMQPFTLGLAGGAVLVILAGLLSRT
jgi:drug/metabolite transporter (DMT)-like permease